MGKSTLARRLADDHPLMLAIDIDGIRCSLGAWRVVEESKLVARHLAMAMSEAHLRSGHDVIVPQYLGQVAFIEELAELAGRVGADFLEFLLLDDDAKVVQRRRARRAELAATGAAHPEATVPADAVEAEVTEAFARLREIARQRPRTRTIRPGDEPL